MRGRARRALPLRERRDKSVPNSEFVVEQTLMNIGEAVTLEELVATFGGPAEKNRAPV